MSDHAAIATLRWLSGTWQSEDAGVVTEESWSLPQSGSMLATGRSMREGRTVFFEFLALREEGDGIAYAAWPDGAAPTQFRATLVNAEALVVENAAHDFPQRIEYRLLEPGRVQVTVEGLQQGQAHRVTFVMQKAEGPTR